MPADGFDFRPNPEQFTFSKQFTHIGFWNTALIGAIVRRNPFYDQKLAEEMKEPANATKETVRDYLEKTFQFCDEVIRELTKEDLTRRGLKARDSGASEHTGSELLLRAYMHMTHHRGQAIVYLRARGIKPPQFKF